MRDKLHLNCKFALALALACLVLSSASPAVSSKITRHAGSSDLLKGEIENIVIGSRGTIQLGNAWCYDSLIDARRCAAGHLRSIAGEFGKDASPHLLAAADAYERVVEALTEGVECPR